MLGLLLFWGAGLALLILPRRWCAHWLVFAPVCGVALVSAVVWAGVHTGFSGTGEYAVWTWFIPLLLIGGAILRRRKAAGGAKAAFARILADGLRRLPVLAVVAIVLLSLTLLMDRASPRLTSFSAGSCDAADYAAGARVLREFAGDDRSGFLGHTEVVQSHSVDNFVDYWLRQNHFTPAAVVAWFSGALGFKVHELVTLLGAVLLAIASCSAYWAARAVFRLGTVTSLLLALAFGFAGSQVYAVAHVALGQLVATAAIVMLNWAGMRVWTEGSTVGRAIGWTPFLAITMWLILGAYNFMIVFAAAPLGAWLIIETLRTRDWARLLRTALTGIAAFSVTGLFAPERMLGLAERFLLFSEHDFGWPVPGFSPERWVGWFGSAGLESGGGWVAIVSGGLAVALIAVWAFVAFRSDRRRLVLAAACIVPVLAAYLYLLERGYTLGTNASYDAFKLFGVFHPLLLAGACAWMSFGRRSRALAAVVVGLAGGLVFIHWAGASQVRVAIEKPVLIVERELHDVRRIEGFGEVDSVNMLLQPFWARLWANSFLLRKPQYFATYTYETRRPTELHGEWDLRDRSIVVNPGAGDFKDVNGRFYLVRRASLRFVDVSLETNWHDPERHENDHWSWSRGIGVIKFSNPGVEPLVVDVRFSVSSFVERDVILRHAGGGLVLWTARVGADRTPVSVAGLELPPGETRLELLSPQPPAGPVSDSRALVVALYDLEVLVGAAPRD